jgi:spore maturation protein CgeB
MRASSQARPTIAFFGSSLVSAYWNGAATYYRGMISALHDCGFDVTFYEPNAYDRQKHRDIEDPPWARVVVYASKGPSGVSSALQKAKTADFIVKTSGVGVFDELLEGAVLDCKAPHATAIYWDVDAPATLDRLEREPSTPLRALIPRYDMVLTYGGGDPVVQAYRAIGAKVCVPIYNALDPATHYPVPPHPRFRADLGFLGNRLPDRESRVERFLLASAGRLPTHRFVLGGNGWQDKPMPPNVRYVGHVYTRDHNAFNCTPRALLNISRDSMARYGYSPATRVFEAAGAGACLITDAWVGIDRFLDPGAEILVAEDGEDVVSHLVDLDPDRARRIGDAARRRVCAEHTYTRRARQLQALLGAGAVA